eukprot:93852-Alexandrium_andersonii.AAC.1
MTELQESSWCAESILVGSSWLSEQGQRHSAGAPPGQVPQTLHAWHALTQQAVQQCELSLLALGETGKCSTHARAWLVRVGARGQRACRCSIECH